MCKTQIEVCDLIGGLSLCWQAATGERSVIVQTWSRGVEYQKPVPTADLLDQPHCLDFQQLIP